MSRVVRTTILALAVAFGIMSVGFGLNTLVKYVSLLVRSPFTLLKQL